MVLGLTHFFFSCSDADSASVLEFLIDASGRAGRDFHSNISRHVVNSTLFTSNFLLKLIGDDLRQGFTHCPS